MCPKRALAASRMLAKSVASRSFHTPDAARVAARQFRIPLLAGGLRRVRYTTQQTRLDAHRRQTNPLGAFAVGRWETGARVALIDDVMTTGSTVGECARVLRAGGASEVEVWALGRTGVSV